MESIDSYARHAVGNPDGCQAATTEESLVSYARHNVLQEIHFPYGLCFALKYNRSQAATSCKNTIFYARHAIGNIDGG